MAEEKKSAALTHKKLEERERERAVSYMGWNSLLWSQFAFDRGSNPGKEYFIFLSSQMPMFVLKVDSAG